MGRRPIDPRRTNNFIDSCAFDPKYSPEDEAANALFKLYEDGKIILNIAHSTQKEIEHPKTPEWVKQQARLTIYTIKTQLTDDEKRKKDIILQILAGKGKVENMIQDSEHVYEASKYGSYFVTSDERILKKDLELFECCNVTILKPSELLEIYSQYERT